jgi:hypothetical protein
MTLKKLLRVTALGLTFMSSSAFADWTQDFVRISCIPDGRFLRVEYTPLSGPDVMVAAHEEQQIRARLKAWRKGGFFDAGNLKYECKLLEYTYQITANQPPPAARGQCSAAPRITLSVKENGSPLLTKVTFGYDCFGGPTVTKLTVFETVSGYGNGGTELCTSPSGNPMSEEKELCGYLNSNEEVSQETLGNFVKKNARK